MNMRNKFYLLAAMLTTASISWSQSVFDAYSLSQQELRGTARFMSMAGAFGALGGDMSVLNQNPGGIGIYRSSDIGLTLDGTFRNSKVTTNAGIDKMNENDFNFNNIGYIGVYRTNSSGLKNFNWGFSYNKKADFRRTYSGAIDGISTSLTNLVAGQTNATKFTKDDLGAIKDKYNPYLDSNAPWMSILAYNSYLINPTNGDRDFVGLMGENSKGYNSFLVDESGQIDEYTISFGGNALNVLYWGASIGIEDVNFSQYTYYEETVNNAVVPGNADGSILLNGTANWSLENSLNLYGTGVNFKLGVILKPINELRIGLAFHTPTRYSMTSEYVAGTNYNLNASNGNIIRGDAYTDEGYVNVTDFTVRTPWKVIGSLAGVLGGRAIVSVDFEHTAYQNMKVLFGGREDLSITDAINAYYKPMETIRVGGEVRVTPKFSVRAGYSYSTSPFSDEIRNNQLNVMTSGTTLAYTLDKNNQYVTAGFGFRSGAFYADFAYIYNQRNSEYFAFSPDIPDRGNPIYSPSADVKDTNHEIVATLGFRF